MLATGRGWEGTHTVLDLLRISPEYVVCSNGAVIMKRTGVGPAAYERFRIETFDPTEIIEVLREHLPEAKYMVELPDGHRLYTTHLGDWHLDNATQVPLDEITRTEVCRVVVVSPEDTPADFHELVQRMGLEDVTYSVGWSAWLDIAPQGVDKSTALEQVRTWLGLDPAHVLVMGDGRNDIGMLRWAREAGGRAIVMAQGVPEVLREGSETTLSVEEGGVADILSRL